MQIDELKEQLHYKIDQLKDEKILEAIHTLISIDKPMFIIPEEWKEGIRQGKDDIKVERVYSLQDFEKKYEKWLGK